MVVQHLTTSLNQTILVDSGMKQVATIPLAIPKGDMGILCYSPRRIVAHPPGGEKSFLSLLQDKMIGDHYSVAHGVPEVIDLTSGIAEQSSAKRKADAKLTALDEAKKPKHGSPAANILVETYWDSPQAKKLFLGDSNDERNIIEVLEQWIE
jgi:hypothetical protein